MAASVSNCVVTSQNSPEIVAAYGSGDVAAAKIPEAPKGEGTDSVLLPDYRRTKRIDNKVKALDVAQNLARATKSAMPLTAACAEIHRMLTAAGLGGEDQAALKESFKGPDKCQLQ